MEKKGRSVNYALYDEEADIMRHLRQSMQARFSRLREELWRLCEKHLDRPPQLGADYVLARVYKHCCILLDLENLLGNKEIENEFYHFKEAFDTRARRDDTRKGFFDVVRQIHTLRNEILQSEQAPDIFERQGFQYNENTFDDLFVKKFKDVLDASAESSDEDSEAEDEPEEPHEPEQIPLQPMPDPEPEYIPQFEPEP
jgi:hypothetical protein